MSDKRARFEAQVLPHIDAAYRFARWLSHAPAEADDIVQEAMLRAFRAFDSLRSADAKGWLLTIVRRCHATARTRAQRRTFVPLPEEAAGSEGLIMGKAEEALIAAGGDPEGAAIRHDHERQLARLLACMSEEHREVLLLREVEDLDYREIAAITGVPIGTVMSRLARARAALKSLWFEDLEGESLGVR